MTSAPDILPHLNPPDPASGRLWRVAWLLLMLALGLFLFSRGITRTDEGRYAETAREMISDGGDFWQIRLMGVRYYEKPPMLYWLSALSMKTFGVSPGAARLPLLLSIAATLGLCFHWSRREWGREAAKVGAAVLLSSMGILVAMSVLLTDPLLVLFFTATCLLLFEAYRAGGPRRRWSWLLAAAAAAWGGVLTKGFIALVLPGAILFLWLLWERRLRDLWRWSLLPVGTLFLLALAAALWQIERYNPGFNLRFIVQEHFQRFTGTREIQGHVEPVWFFIPVLLALLAPWTFFAPRAIRHLRAHGDLKTDSFSRFLLVWAGVVFLFFSASSGKVISYIMPMVPPMAMLLARRGLLPPRTVEAPADRRLWAFGAFLPLLVPVGIAIFWGVARLGLANRRMGPPSLWVFLPIAFGLIFWGWIWLRGHWKTFSGLLLSAAIGYLSFAFLTTPLAGADFLAGFRDHRQLALEISHQVGENDILVLCHGHNPALAFNLERVPWMYHVWNELTPGMEMEPDLPGIFHTPEELVAAVKARTGQTVYAVASDKERLRMEEAGLRFAPDPVLRDRRFLLLRLRPSP